MTIGLIDSVMIVGKHENALVSLAACCHVVAVLQHTVFASRQTAAAMALL
jgi:hypothetical protein